MEPLRRWGGGMKHPASTHTLFVMRGSVYNCISHNIFQKLLNFFFVNNFLMNNERLKHFEAYCQDYYQDHDFDKRLYQS